MPTSWYQAIPDILDQIVDMEPKSILDVGVGFGKYGVLIREVLDIARLKYKKDEWNVIIDGIEGFQDYKNPLHEFVYNKIYYSNIMELLKNGLGNYDCILLIDVLEHFSKEEGLELIDKLLSHTNKSLIISTPLYPEENNEYLGNELENHISRWSIIDFVKYDYSYKQIKIDNNAAQIIQIYPSKTNIKNNEKNTILCYKKSKLINKKLNIGYLLPNANLTGGMKMLLLQMKELCKRGHNIIAFFRENKMGETLPDWMKIDFAKVIIIPENDYYDNYIKECDIVMSGWLSQILEIKNRDIPIVYWEQGNEFLFGDYNNLFKNSNERQLLYTSYPLFTKVASVSKLIEKIMKIKFNINSTIINNFIDCNFYYPQEHSFNSTILLVGNPFLRFKGFDIALATLQKLWLEGFRFNVKWICQNKPYISGTTFPLEFVEKPSQEILANEYRNADICLFTSWYEGFGMVPLEAMASVTPVVTTDCGGVLDYVVPGFNALVVDPGDINSLAGAVAYLLSNSEARKILSKNGRETALKFVPENIIPKLEDFLIDSLS